MKSAHDETNDILQDFMTTKRRMDALNHENHRMDAAIECLVSLIITGIIFTGLGLLYWYQKNDGTDSGCVEDCLEPERK